MQQLDNGCNFCKSFISECTSAITCKVSAISLQLRSDDDNLIIPSIFFIQIQLLSMLAWICISRFKFLF